MAVSAIRRHVIPHRIKTFIKYIGPWQMMSKRQERVIPDWNIKDDVPSTHISSGYGLPEKTKVHNRTVWLQTGQQLGQKFSLREEWKIRQTKTDQTDTGIQCLTKTKIEIVFLKKYSISNNLINARIFGVKIDLRNLTVTLLRGSNCDSGGVLVGDECHQLQ
jgi:hypothetical protein